MSNPRGEQLYEQYLENPTLLNCHAVAESHMDGLRAVAGLMTSKCPLEFGELLSVAYLGAFHAVRTFNPTKKSSLSTYLLFRARHTIMDFLREEDHIPRVRRFRNRMLNEQRLLFYNQHGFKPNKQELQKFMMVNLKMKKYVFEIMYKSNFVEHNNSLNTPIPFHRQGDFELQDTLVNLHEQSPCSRLDNSDAAQWLMQNKMNPQERQIFEMYYFEKCTMLNIGIRIGLTESRVSQIHGATIRRIKEQCSRQQSEYLAA